jgi:hypothetical protein
MDITESMLEAAMRKATEAGLFSRRCTSSDRANYREIMYSVLAAFVEAAQAEGAFMEARSMAYTQRDLRTGGEAEGLRVGRKMSCASRQG